MFLVVSPSPCYLIVGGTLNAQNINGIKILCIRTEVYKQAMYDLNTVYWSHFGSSCYTFYALNNASFRKMQYPLGV